jgi:hypothetical protein
MREKIGGRSIRINDKDVSAGVRHNIREICPRVGNINGSYAVQGGSGGGLTGNARQNTPNPHPNA